MSISNAYKKTGSILILSVIVLLCISVLSLLLFKSLYVRKNAGFIELKCCDLYDRRDYSNTLSLLNNYVWDKHIPIEDLKSRQIFISDKIQLIYDGVSDKFYLQYKYVGIVYKRTLHWLLQDKNILFIPEEKKYITRRR